MTGRLPAPLAAELRGLREELPRIPARRLLRQARAAALLITWCRRALAQSHLVSVAAALHDSLRLGRDEMRSLRIPVDLLDLFPRWKEGSREGFRAPRRYASLVPASATVPLGPVRLQLTTTAGVAPLVLPLLRGLEAHLDRTVPITVMIEPGRAALALRRAARDVLRDPRRVRFEVVRAATTYARDHGLAARTRAGSPVLLVPRGFRPERGKEDDALDARRAHHALGARVRRSRLYWEGGNILFDGHRCLLGVDTVRENMGRLGLAAEEVITILEIEFGVTVATIGELSRSRFDGTQDRLARSGQASYHLDLDLCPLGSIDGGRPVMLLSDPELGLDVLPKVLAHPRLAASHGLPARLGRRLQADEYRRVADARRPRLQRYRQQLERLGYRLVALPELRVDSARRIVGTGNIDLSCCNALPALHRGRPAVYHLPWGIPEFDALAGRQWRRAGVRPIALSGFGPLAHGMMELAAGLHCFVGTVAARAERRRG